MRWMPSAVVATVLFSGCSSSDPVLAKVGPLKIRRSEFDRKLAEVSQSYQNYVTTPDGRRQFLDVLIRERLVLAAAGKSDVSQSAEFKAEMARLRAEEEDRIREGREFLLTRMWLDDLRGKGVFKSSEEELREYHKKYPVEVSVRHILIGDPDEAGLLAKQIRAGANFAAVAKAKSLDAATAGDGGRMPPAVYGEIIPDLENVVFSMRVAEVSGPIKSKFGYHILKKDSEKRMSFDEARERIMKLLEKQKLDRHLQSIQEKYPVEVLDDQFK